MAGADYVTENLVVGDTEKLGWEVKSYAVNLEQLSICVERGRVHFEHRYPEVVSGYHPFGTKLCLDHGVLEIAGVTVVGIPAPDSRLLNVLVYPTRHDASSGVLFWSGYGHAQAAINEEGETWLGVTEKDKLWTRSWLYACASGVPYAPHVNLDSSIADVFLRVLDTSLGIA